MHRVNVGVALKKLSALFTFVDLKQRHTDERYVPIVFNEVMWSVRCPCLTLSQQVLTLIAIDGAAARLPVLDYDRQMTLTHEFGPTNWDS